MVHTDSKPCHCEEAKPTWQSGLPGKLTCSLFLFPVPSLHLDLHLRLFPIGRGDGDDDPAALMRGHDALVVHARYGGVGARPRQIRRQVPLILPFS